MLSPFISDTKDKHPTFILASHGAECYRHSFPTLMTNTRHLFLASYGAECYRHSFQTFRPNFLSRYAPDCTILSPKMQKLRTVGGGTPPSHTLPPPSIASLPRNISCSVFWLSNVGKYAIVCKLCIRKCVNYFLGYLDICHSYTRAWNILTFHLF